MKVIQSPPAFHPIQKDCRGCDAKVEIELSDIRHYVEDMLGAYDSYYFAKCCVCGHSIRLEDTLIPTHERQKIQARGRDLGY